jgi:UrcA family protein
MKGFVGAVVVISGGLTASWAATAAAASEIDIGLGTVAVQFERQELASPAGIARIYQRLRLASDQVCLPYESILLQRQRAHDRCVAESLARAVTDVGDAGLTAYSEHRLPARLPLAQARPRAAR